MVHRIRQFDEANNCKVLAGMTPLDVEKAQAKLEASGGKDGKTGEKTAAAAKKSHRGHSTEGTSLSSQ